LQSQLAAKCISKGCGRPRPAPPGLRTATSDSLRNTDGKDGSGGGIKSAASPDGLTFTIENGFRLTQEAAGFTGTTVSATTGPTVIGLADGRYRMYFSDLPRPGDPPGGHRIKSAVSADQLTWTVEPGIRIGPGAPALTESASTRSPSATPMDR